MNDISRCRREVKRWLALVALTLAALLTGMVSAVTAPSPEAQEIANFLMIASVTAIICSLFGVKQSNDHCRSVQYGLSVFEAMKKDLEGTEIELEETRGRLHEVENELAQTQEWLYRTENVLEETRDWICETDDAFVQTRDRLEETENELASVKSELSKAKLKLRLKEVKAQRAERCYESLRKTYSEATLDLLKTKRERDNLRRELVLARKVIRKLIAGRNKLRYELTEAKIGFEWFLSLYYEAEERIRFAKQQIERLENAQSELEETQKSERDKLQSELNEATEKVDWFRRKYFEVWRKTLRQSYNAKRQAVNLESILKNLDEATEIADLREKLKMVINRLSSEDSRE